jgi:gliding motility-associated-like protein
MISFLKLVFVIFFFQSFAFAQIIATNDVVNLPQGQGSAILNPTNNDIFSGNLTRIISKNPEFGFGSFDALGNLIYTQTKDTCNISDSLQYTICMSPIQCSSAWIFVNIECTGYEMQAIDDEVSANDSENFIFNFTENDILPFQSFSIIKNPIYGQVVSNLGYEITYRATQCGKTDTIKYKLCNNVKCDTATALINIAPCFVERKIEVYNAISPNGDGKNDVFYISEVQEFPENNLQILNRWGQLVFEMKNYNNTWNGKNKAGKDLEDGVYYYILELGQSNTIQTNKKFLKGSLMLMR